jgi:hypothetical protein
MAGALFYLTICSMRNRLRVKLRRLREPAYAAGLVVGLLYLYRFVSATSFEESLEAALRHSPDAHRALPRSGGDDRQPGHLCAGGGRLAAAGFKPPLTFSRAEVQFLFQAPVSRRQLVQYKLTRTQTAALFGAAMMTLFMRPSSLAAV